MEHKGVEGAWEKATPVTNDNAPLPRSNDKKLHNGWQAPNPGYTPPRLDIIDPAQWQGQEPPARPWLVPGWIPRGEVTLLYGVGGAGKSILVLQLMVAAALGIPWAGHPVERAKSLYFSCEDNGNEIWRRLAKILPAYGSDCSDMSGLVGLIDRARESDNALMDYIPPADGYGRGAFDTTTMYQSLYREAVEFGAGLVVIDSLYNAFAGNENSRNEANKFLNNMARLAADLSGGEGGAVVILAHPSRAGRETGEGGVTAWSDACRSRLQFRHPETPDGEPEDKDARELICRKMNFGPDGQVANLQWEDGVFMPLESDIGFVGTLDRTAKANRAKEVFLMLLDRREAEGRPVSHKSRAGNYAPKEFAKTSDRQGLRRHDFEAAMEMLFADNVIHGTNYGDAPSRMFDKIERVK